MRLLKFVLVGAVLCLQSLEINAKPFFNPFNVAVKTGRTDEGHKISLLYPKKSYDVSFNIKSQTVNEHKFDFASLISSFTRFLPKPGQGFSFPHPFKKATTTTTTEANDSFDDDDTPGGSNWSSSDDTPDSSSSDNDKPSSDDTSLNSSNDSDVDENSDPSSDTNGSDSNGGKPGKNCNCKNHAAGDSASSFSMEAAKISYIPPDTVNDYFAPDSEDSAASPKINVNYLPPK